MNGNEFYYCILENNVIYIPKKYKNKGKNYGIVNLNLKQINALAECIDLQSVTPSISPKFSQRIESFLLPRFDEINRMIYTIKPQPTELGIEISKENLNDILKGLSFATVITGLKDRGYSLEELSVALKKVKFEKFK
ncbi:MAG: hypothetical protein ACFFDF_00545 [Candidatus Odinarchaeota archaeon]